MRVYNAVLDWVVRACAMLACFAIATMTVLIVGEVILRTFFASTMYFTEEFSGYMVLAIFALGVPYAREKNALLTVEFVIDRLSPPVRRRVDFIYGLVSLGFCVLLNWYAIQLFLKSIERELTAPTVLRTPLWMPQLLIPLGITLLCLVTIRKLVRPDPVDQRQAGDTILQE